MFRAHTFTCLSPPRAQRTLTAPEPQQTVLIPRAALCRGHFPGDGSSRVTPTSLMYAPLPQSTQSAHGHQGLPAAVSLSLWSRQTGLWPHSTGTATPLFPAARGVCPARGAGRCDNGSGAAAPHVPEPRCDLRRLQAGDPAVTRAAPRRMKSRAIIPLIRRAPSGPRHICQPPRLRTHTVPSHPRFCCIFTKKCKLVPTAANIFNIIERITCIFTW